MRIAFDARFLESNKMPEARDFTNEVFGRIAKQHPEHHFIFFVDSVLTKPAGLPENVTVITIKQKLVNAVMYKWWYDVRLAIALSKYKADLFVGSYGLISLRTSLPQILIVRDLSFLHKSYYSPYNSHTFYRRFTHFFIKKAKAIVTLSDFIKEELINRYKPASAIQAIGSGVDDFYKPVEWEERESIKQQFAEGCEYFVFTGGLHPRANFLNALKAFSIFKKWQKSNMKLVVAGKFTDSLDKDLEKLHSYKYRNDVIIKRDASNEQMASIIAASYAMIFPSFYEGFATPVLAAIRCEVPVITSSNSSMSEIAADAALYADPYKPQEIAEQMKLIFKDEQLRNKLIEASKQRSELFSWNKTAALLWQVIEEALSR